jgi:hypothetical protein
MHTGFAVNAAVEVFRNGDRIAEISADSNGTVLFQSAPGRYDFSIHAPGYHELKTCFTIAAGETLEVQVNLDKKASEEGLPKQSAAAFLPPHTARFSGYVTDMLSGKSLADVSVALDESGAETRTDSRGFFVLDYPLVPEAPDASKLPTSVSLVFHKPSYKRTVLSKYAIPGELQIKVALERGSGEQFIEKDHGLFREKLNHLLDPLPGSQSAPLKKSAQAPAPYLEPPPSIRVGTNCGAGRTNCGSVQVMSLDSYVNSGLNDEWFGSWNIHSLRAGAIAFRSYGASFVGDPVTANFDICASTYCQAWDSDQYPAAVEAGSYTTGIMLERDGVLARSEYSAELNNSGCGNGYAGTGSSWPCNSDEVCAGQPSNGHGRGMCQWGTQRWAEERSMDWHWITDHYYLIGGYEISSPVRLTQVSAGPAQANPGTLLTVSGSYVNSALERDEVLVVAALRQNDSVLIDSAWDQKIALDADSGTFSRQFNIPGHAAGGNYDLIVSLWIDVDEDNAVTSEDMGGDFLLARLTRNNAVTVQAPVLTGNGTEIRYFLPHQARGELSIFDLQGSLVRRFKTANLPEHAGLRRVVWDGKDGQNRRVASGIYICRLHGNNVSLARVLIVGSKE